MPNSNSEGPASEALVSSVSIHITTGDDTKLEDILSLTPGQAAKAIIELAAGDRDRRTALLRLMLDPKITNILIHALNDMRTDERVRLIQIVGEIPDPDVASIRSTLTVALDHMVQSRRDQTLREALKGQDSAAIREVTSYLASGPGKALYFLRSLVLDRSIEGSKLHHLMLSINSHCWTAAMESLSECATEDVLELFKLICDIAADGNHEDLRIKIENAISSMNCAGRNKFLTKIITDSDGNSPTDCYVNKAQRFVANYCKRKGVEGVRALLSSMPNTAQPAWHSFLFWSVRDDEIMRLMIDNIAKTTPNGLLSIYIRNEPGKRKFGVYAKVATKMIFGAAVTFFQPVLLPALIVLGHKEISSDLNECEARSTHVPIIDEVMRLVRQFQSSARRNNLEEISHIRQQIVYLLGGAYIRAILNLPPSDLRDILNVFLHAPADMSGLRNIVLTLPPQLSAKLARAISISASETAAETRAGSWTGDLLKGLTISGKMSGSFGNKNTDKDAKTIEHSGQISAEIGFSWSPSALVDGMKTRELNHLTKELNSFMSDWMVQLNNMSPNQKAVFLEEMKDAVRIELKV